MRNVRLVQEKGKTDFVSDLKSVIMTLLLLVFFGRLIFQAPFLDSAVGWITAAAVLISLPFSGRGTRAVCLGLFGAGACLMYASGAGWQSVAGAAGKNAALLVLLVTVPMIGIPLKYGGYIEVLDALASRYIRRRHQMYWVPALFSHILGVFMNLGAVPLTHEITARGRLAGYPGVLARSISRGFSAALLWSPNMIVTALVLSYLHVPWQEYARLGIMFAGVALVVGYAVNIFSREVRRVEEEPSPGGEGPCVDRVKLAQLAAVGVVFLLVVVLIETRTRLPVISAVPVIALILPAAWMCLLGRQEGIRSGYVDYFRNRINRFDGEVVLFSAAGFFSGVFASSGWSQKLCDYILLLSGQTKAVTAVTILAPVIAASLLGIHPMVLVSAFAASLDPAALGFSQVELALALIAGWALGANVSPMSGTCLVVAGLTGKTPLEVGCMNFPHTFLTAAAVVIYLARG